MDCKTVRTYGLALLDRELSPRRARSMQAHIDRCPSCGAALARMASLYEAAETAAEERPPARLWPRVAEAIDRWEDRRTPWTLLGGWIPRAAAVCAMLLLMLAGVAAGICLGSGPDASVSRALREYTALSGLDRFDDLQAESLGSTYITLTLPEEGGRTE
ncbi:zf-HC2 domain-containing protein [bacterium]|nr:zf-HC2 domain-containing protein [bacterium]